MRNRFKRKNKINFKILLIVFIFLLTFYFMMGLFFSGESIKLKDMLFTSSLKEIVNEDSIFTKYLNVNISTPENLLYASLNKIISNEDLVTFSGDEYFDYDNSVTDYVEEPNKKEIEKPIVYIYNTHQLEEYNIDVLYDYSIKPNVMIASYILKEKLLEKGIPSIVEINNIKKYLNNNNLKYNKSYLASRYFAKEMLKKEPTIEYMIDIHRDSARYKNTLFTYENKKYARILFVVGLDHTNYKNNLELATTLNSIFNKEYPGFSRGITKKTGKGVNGVYNQDLSKNAILLEVGGVDNDIEEVNNSMDLISKVLSDYIKGDMYE